MPLPGSLRYPTGDYWPTVSVTVAAGGRLHRAGISLRGGNLRKDTFEWFALAHSLRGTVLPGGEGLQQSKGVGVSPYHSQDTERDECQCSGSLLFLTLSETSAHVTLPAPLRMDLPTSAKPP